VVATHTRSRTRRPGGWSAITTESVGEREAPLLLAQDVLRLAEDRALAFTAGRPPLLLERGDWRTHRELAARQGRPMPALLSVPDLPPLDPAEQEPAEPVLLHGLDDRDRANPPSLVGGGRAAARRGNRYALALRASLDTPWRPTGDWERVVPEVCPGTGDGQQQARG
jgi:hypothetical protein